MNSISSLIFLAVAVVPATAFFGNEIINETNTRYGNLFRNTFNQSTADFLFVAASISKDMQNNFFTFSRLWSKFCNLIEPNLSFDPYCVFIESLRDVAKVGVNEVRQLLQNSTMKDVTEKALADYLSELYVVLENFIGYVSDMAVNVRRLSCYFLHYQRVSERIESEIYMAVQDFFNAIEDKLTVKSASDYTYYAQQVVELSEKCVSNADVARCLGVIARNNRQLIATIKADIDKIVEMIRSTAVLVGPDVSDVEDKFLENLDAIENAFIPCNASLPNEGSWVGDQTKRIQSHRIPGFRLKL